MEFQEKKLLIFTDLLRNKSMAPKYVSRNYFNPMYIRFAASYDKIVKTLREQ